MPMIPNISIDNAVERHLKALALNGDREWEPGASKFQEWEERKQVSITVFRHFLISVIISAWRSDAKKRDKQRKRKKKKQAGQQGRQQAS